VKSLTPAKLTVFMLVAVGGLITAYIAKGLLATEDGPRSSGTRVVPMALANLKPGTMITEAHIGNGDMLISELQAETLLNERGVVGRIVKDPIAAAMPILSSQLYLPGEFPPLNVSAGMRAVAVSLSESESMVNGLLSPGQYVDVHWTPSSVDQSDPRFRGGLTLTLFKGVKLLTISREASDLGNSGNAVTLEVSPEQANILILARDKGEVTLTYNPQGKGTGSVAVGSEDRATLDELLGLRPLPTPKTFVTEHYRGPAHSTVEFRDGKRFVGADDAAMPSASNSGGVSANPQMPPAAPQGPAVPAYAAQL
jgi:pilus assembly protein CpaB